MQKKTQIFLSCAWIPNPDDQMEGLFLLRYAQNLYASGYDPVIIGVKASQTSTGLKTYQQDFIPIRIQYYKGNRINRMIAWKSLMDACISEYGLPKLIWHHVLDYNSVVVQYLASKRNIKVYATEHWSRWFKESTTDFRLFELPLIKRSASKLAGISAVSRNLASLIEIETEIEIPYITPVPVSEEYTHITIDNQPKLTNYIVHISCFDNSSKRITKLIEEFLKFDSEVKLVLIGTGVDYQDIYDKYQNEFRLHFTGEILNKQKIGNYLTHAIALIQSSLYETYSMVVTEALICGCPIISTQVGVWSEIQNDQLGHTMPKNFKKNDIFFGIEKVKHLDRQVIQNQAINLFLSDHDRLNMLSFLWLH